MSDPSSSQFVPDELAVLAARGDRVAWAALMGEHRARLRRIVATRLDPRLSGVVDPSDVIQETFAEVHQRLAEYNEERKFPFFVWLRCIAADRLSALHRHHFGVQARDANRTKHAGAFLGGMPDASSIVLSECLTAKDSDALNEAIRAERRARVAAALDDMSLDDREVLVLRHFEGLSAVETSIILGISEAASRKRYLRALERFTLLLQGLPGGLGGFIS